MSDIVHFHLRVNFATWQGYAVRLACFAGWEWGARYFARLLVDRMIHEQHGGPP